MKAIFITGTDTGAGKTLISGLLGRYLLSKGYRVITQKWVETGSKDFSLDIRQHLKLMGKTKRDIVHYLPLVSPYNFTFPASPHLASQIDKKSISINKIKKSFKLLSHKFDYVIVEGVGGALVPITKKKLLIDLAKELNLPVVIVSGNKLGAINHTLLTIEALLRRKMRIAGIIFNNQPTRQDRVVLKDNPNIVKEISGENILGILPWTKDKSELYRKFRPIGRKLTAYLEKKR